jgi:hypothetical protein
MVLSFPCEWLVRQLLLPPGAPRNASGNPLHIARRESLAREPLDHPKQVMRKVPL